MQLFNAVKQHSICSGLLGLLFSLAIFSQTPAPAGKIVVLQSKATNKYVATWNEGVATDIHASALNADDTRAAVAIVDAGNGFVALRSIEENKYWTVQGTDAGIKVFCSSPDITENALFTWIENGDNTISLQSKASSRFLSVVEEDTIIIPDYSKVPSGSNLIITEEMLKPYIVKFAIVRSSASDIGNQEKFVISSAGLKKQLSSKIVNSKVLSFFYSQYGKKTVTGIHNKEPNSNPLQYTNSIYSKAGVYPALWSADFQFQAVDQTNRPTMISAGIAQWNKGAVVNLMYHMCSPLTTESCTWSGGVGGSKPSAAQFTELITNGTALNTTLKTRLKNIAPYFQQLAAQGIEVLFRPWHEMNQGFFWWGGFTGTNGTARLFQITHDYLQDSLKLTNIIWVWNIQDLNFTWATYSPGASYYDIMSCDVYSMGFTTTVYNNVLDLAGTKPMGVGECYTIPTVAQLTAQPKWGYFCGWAEGTTGDIKGVYTAANTLSLDEMPGWGGTAVQVRKADGSLFFNVSVRAGKVRFEMPENGHAAITLHNARGQLVASVVNGEFGAGPQNVGLSDLKLSQGIYVARIAAANRETSQKVHIY
jgi:beta-mannanase